MSPFGAIADLEQAAHRYAMRSRSLRFLALLLVSSGCSRPIEEIERPEARHVLSRVDRGGEGEVILGATFSGGGAGDTTYGLLACSRGAASCEVMGSIDWAYWRSSREKAQPPRLVAEGDRIMLEIGPSDGIHGFKNFSQALPSLNRRGAIYLRYRDTD